MERPPPLCDDCRPNNSDWIRRRTAISCIVAALALVCCGVIALKESSNPSFDRSFASTHEGPRLREQEQHVDKALSDQDTGCVGGNGVITSGGTHDRCTTHWKEEEQVELNVEGDRGNDVLGEDLVQNYSSFVEYALETYNSSVGAPIPLPVVHATGVGRRLSIPIITIIGAQKGGTTNLRQNLLSHPMVGGRLKELDFFDRKPGSYPSVGTWEGEGLGKDIGFQAAATILRQYASSCLTKTKRNLTKTETDLDHESDINSTGLIVVDSSPQYMVCPIVPYRVKMVRPGARFVAVLRDPTDRYFSQVRMDMCRDNHLHSNYTTMAEKINSTFHLPGEAEKYLAAGELAYEPYTALCRGENASTSDLWKCYQAQIPSMPLYRGLYADHLERWFRVFDRSQIMIIDASDMLANFSAVVNAVATFAGLPEHDFQYDPSHEHKTGCLEYDQRLGNNYFVPGGRYDMMYEEVELFREWYRPHNERLYKLLDRDFMWQ
eukprot:jgi/Undpi1/1736/HiC_scaffold_11.g05126.m1